MNTNDIKTDSFIKEIYDKMEMKCSLIRLYSDSDLILEMNILGKYDELYTVVRILREDLSTFTKEKLVLALSKKYDRTIKMYIKWGIVEENYIDIKIKKFEKQEELNKLVKIIKNF